MTLIVLGSLIVVLAVIVLLVGLIRVEETYAPDEAPQNRRRRRQRGPCR